MNGLTCRSHEWSLQQDEGYYACLNCSAIAMPCVECGDPLASESQLVCDSCVAHWRHSVSQIGTWVTTYQANPFTFQRSPRYDPNRVTTSEDDARLPFGLDEIEPDPEGRRLRGLPDAVARLVEWAATWAERRGDPVPRNWALEYLESRVLWAMQNRVESDWPIFSRELLEVRTVVQRALGIAPVREPVPCVQCGGQIVRQWTAKGLADMRVCTRCGSKWFEGGALAHTNHLVMQELPETHPELQVTLADANRIYRGRIVPHQLHMWVKRGRLLAVNVNVRGEALYVLGDIMCLTHGRTPRPPAIQHASADK